MLALSYPRRSLWMTTASVNNLAGGKRKKSARPSWNRLWQMPLLLAGGTAFGFGVRALVKAYKPVPFATQAAGVRNLLTGGKYEEAINAINMLGAYYKGEADQA